MLPQNPVRYRRLAFWAMLFVIATASVLLRAAGVSGKFGYSLDFEQAIRQSAFLLSRPFDDLYTSPGDKADHPVALFRCLKIAADTSYSYDIAFQLLAKGFYATFELLTVGLVVATTLLLFGETSALCAAALYLLVPVFSYVGSFWGHHGCVEVFFTFGSILGLAQRRYALSLISLGAALTFRVHAVVVAPFILFVFLVERVHWKTRLVAISAGIASHTLLTLPLILETGWDAYRFQYTGHLRNYSELTLGAYNIWSFSSMASFANSLNLRDVCSWFVDCPSSLDNPTLLGFLMFSIGYIVAAFIYLRFRKINLLAAVLLPAALIYLCFYFLPTRIHERYIYHFLVLCTPLAARLYRFLIPFLVLVVTTLTSFAFFPSYLLWLQVQIGTSSDQSMVNEISIAAFCLLIAAFITFPRSVIHPPVVLGAKGHMLVGILSSLPVLSLFPLLGLMYIHEHSSDIRETQNILESRMPEAQVFNREETGAVTKGVWNLRKRGFEFPGKHDWWSIVPLSWADPRGVLRMGVLAHPQPGATRVLEVPITSNEEELTLRGQFDNSIADNPKPANVHVSVLVDDVAVAESLLAEQRYSFILKTPLPNSGKARALRIEIKAINYQQESQLNNLHLYLSAQVR